MMCGILGLLLWWWLLCKISNLSVKGPTNLRVRSKCRGELYYFFAVYSKKSPVQQTSSIYFNFNVFIAPSEPTTLNGPAILITRLTQLL